jgi:hypothetical protein
MQPQRPITISTLGDFLAHPGHTLRAICPRCQHSEPLDVRRLVARFGGDIRPIELAPLLRSRDCDQKGGEIQVNADTGFGPRPSSLA